MNHPNMISYKQYYIPQKGNNKVSISWPSEYVHFKDDKKIFEDYSVINGSLRLRLD
jgi:hypothetical protein